MMKLLALLLVCATARAQTAHNCASWRGQVFLDQSDGTFVILDNQVLYSFDVSADPQTYMFGPFDDPTNIQLLSVSVASVDWFGLEDGPALAACQWTLGYKPAAAKQQFFNKGFLKTQKPIPVTGQK